MIKNKGAIELTIKEWLNMYFWGDFIEVTYIDVVFSVLANLHVIYGFVLLFLTLVFLNEFDLQNRLGMYSNRLNALLKKILISKNAVAVNLMLALNFFIYRINTLVFNIFVMNNIYVVFVNTVCVIMYTYLFYCLIQINNRLFEKWTMEDTNAEILRYLDFIVVNIYANWFFTWHLKGFDSLGIGQFLCINASVMLLCFVFVIMRIGGLLERWKEPGFGLYLTLLLIEIPMSLLFFVITVINFGYWSY